MMSSMQISACLHHVKVKNISPAFSPSCYPATSQACISPTNVLLLHKVLSRGPRLVYNAANSQKCAPVCLFGGKGKSENNNESSPWKSLEKAMGGFKKEPDVQDLLRKQMQEREFDDGDGGAGNRPGGGGDGSGGSEDEGFAGIWDEFVQVFLATVGFIFLYIYLINGDEMNRIAKDYIKYLFGGDKSVRLRRNMYAWGRFYRHITRKKVVQRDWLERAILNTPTWWYSPRLYRQMKQIADSYEPSR
eukprot:TRINITY_DN6472_c0_g2_i2.p1 TRINITY_DN6472_c0_g2~~TRINITY_DN6472_c0_g2_i2.p1  ORF type:complete len:247 (+),score=53.41 TRINITY_DN6472_c0_g2_i2:156-896(+)